MLKACNQLETCITTKKGSWLSMKSQIYKIKRLEVLLTTCIPETSLMKTNKVKNKLFPVELPKLRNNSFKDWKRSELRKYKIWLINSQKTKLRFQNMKNLDWIRFSQRSCLVVQTDASTQRTFLAQKTSLWVFTTLL